MHDTTASSESDSGDDELGRLLRLLVRTGGLLEPNHLPHDHGELRVSASELLALGELADGGALSQQDLGARLGLEKSTVSRLAAGLEARGWLVRERDPDNRRVYQLTLTADGRHLAHRVRGQLRSHHDQLLARLTPAERDGLILGLTALIRELPPKPQP